MRCREATVSCVAVHCSVLQCIAVCCSALQCVAACLQLQDKVDTQCVAIQPLRSVLQCIIVCCSIFAIEG